MKTHMSPPNLYPTLCYSIFCIPSALMVLWKASMVQLQGLEVCTFLDPKGPHQSTHSTVSSLRTYSAHYPYSSSFFQIISARGCGSVIRHLPTILKALCLHTSTSLRTIFRTVLDLHTHNWCCPIYSSLSSPSITIFPLTDWSWLISQPPHFIDNYITPVVFCFVLFSKIYFFLFYL